MSGTRIKNNNNTKIKCIVFKQIIIFDVYHKILELILSTPYTLRERVLCFSANSTTFSKTGKPLRRLTAFI